MTYKKEIRIWPNKEYMNTTRKRTPPLAMQLRRITDRNEDKTVEAFKGYIFHSWYDETEPTKCQVDYAWRDMTPLEELS